MIRSLDLYELFINLSLPWQDDKKVLEKDGSFVLEQISCNFTTITICSECGEMTMETVPLLSEIRQCAAETISACESSRDLGADATELNGHFNHLLKLLHRPMTWQEQYRILKDPAIQAQAEPLRVYLATIEAKHEDAVATTMLDSARIGKLQSVETILQEFEQNYQTLLGGEIRLMHKVAPDKIDPSAPMAFVGAGPMPITAMLWNRWTGQPVICFDRNPQAVAVGSAVLKVMGFEGKIDYHYTPTPSDMDFSQASCVFLAALVEGKGQVLSALQKTTAQRAPEDKPVVIIRAVRGKYRLRYYPYQPSEDGIEALTLGRTQTPGKTSHTTSAYRL